MTCLIIPGLHSSGPGHWQSAWEAERHDCRRVDLGDWDDPDRAGWIGGLTNAVAQGEGPFTLVAHSLGCLAVAWWAGTVGSTIARVTGALLVAPPDVDRADGDARLRRFAPMPRRAMPFPTIVVASRNDPYACISRSREMAAAWSASLYDMGEAGHINAASALGSWREGQDLLLRLSPSARSHDGLVAPAAGASR